MDDKMCEDVRIGIAARQEFENRTYRRKVGGPALSFGSALLDIAGGFGRFLREWEVDDSFREVSK